MAKLTLLCFPTSPNKSTADANGPRFEKFRRWQAFGERLLKRDDLVAYYDFQPDRSDLSVLRNRVPSGKHGRIEHARWAPGCFLGKYALHYNNSKSIARVDLSGLEGSRQLTLAAWIRCDEWPKKGAYILVNNSGWVPGLMAWVINGEDRMSFHVVLDEERHAFRAVFRKAALIKQGQWGFLAVTCDLDSQKAYVFCDDGQFISGVLDSPIPDSLTFAGGPYSIGNWYSSRNASESADYLLHGYVGELMVFRSVLSPDEIDRLRRESDPMAYDKSPDQPGL